MDMPQRKLPGHGTETTCDEGHVLRGQERRSHPRPRSRQPNSISTSVLRRI